jgi:bifunctional non-homologous end joining protein LigD
VVVPADDGTTDFSVLQNELKGRSKKIAMVAFDLLYLNGYDLRKLPLFERKSLLKKIIDKTDIQFSESFEVDGGEMYKHACMTGLEGVVSKVRDSRYVSGRVNDWVKKTCAQRETLGSFSRSASEPGIAVPQTSSRSSSVSRLLRADGVSRCR